MKEGADHHILTVLDGEYQGEKLLLCDNSAIYASKQQLLCSELARNAESSTGIHALGDIHYFVQMLTAEKRVYICGAGHVALAVIRIGKMLDTFI